MASATEGLDFFLFPFYRGNIDIIFTILTIVKCPVLCIDHLRIVV